jgi:hypothetical protein
LRQRHREGDFAEDGLRFTNRNPDNGWPRYRPRLRTVTLVATSAAVIVRTLTPVARRNTNAIVDAAI